MQQALLSSNVQKWEKTIQFELESMETKNIWHIFKLRHVTSKDVMIIVILKRTSIRPLKEIHEWNIKI